MRTTSEKFKDDPPIKTINKIRNILMRLGIFPIESRWKNPIKNIYSVNLRIPETNLFVNGKGISIELALASAYGELMERLQNQFLYPNVQFDDSVNRYLGFYHSPDEKYVSPSELLKSSPEEICEIFKPIDGNNRNKFEYLKLLANKQGFTCLPFYNLNNDRIVYLPTVFLKYYYESNGMSAGNTPEEALVQGISECLERYANKEVLTNDIVPPTIPRKYIREIFPQQHSIIQDIEKNEKYEIIVKDCSLGEKLPVIAAILIDKERNSYFVKFGAHPILEIALERCLTELMQGKDLDTFLGFSFFEYGSDLYKRKSNLESIFSTGSGLYPSHFFSDEFSYQFQEFSFKTFSNNKEALKYLVDLIVSLNYQILIRDVSFLGFPAYHTIILGMSEISMYTTKEYEHIGKKCNIGKLIIKIKDCSKEKLEEIVNFIREEDSLNNKSLSDLLGLPVDASFPWNKINYNLFLTTAYYKLGKIDKAYQHLLSYIDFLQDRLNDEKILSYYKCCRDYFRMLKEGKKRCANQLLKVIYKDTIVDEVISDLEDPQKAFQYYKSPCNYVCSECTFREHCYYESVKKLHTKLKVCMKNKPIDQKDVSLTIKNILAIQLEKKEVNNEKIQNRNSE